MDITEYEEDQLEQEEEQEPTYHTWDEANDRGYTQRDFV